MNGAERARFHDFVVMCGRPLLRTAYLLTDNWQDAENLLERALVHTYVRWPRIEELDPTGDTLHALIHSYVDSRRAQRRSRAQVLGEDETPAWRAVRGLSPAERTALVLRLHGGLTGGQTAAAIGLPEERVGLLVADALLHVATTLDAGTDIDALRTVERQLRADMADRTAEIPPAPARFALVQRRAVRARRWKVAVGALTALALVASGFLLRSATRTSSSRATRATAQSTGQPPTPTATASVSSGPLASAAPPAADLSANVVVDGQVIDVDKAATDAIAELGSGDWSVAAADSAYVARQGPERKPAPLVIVSGGAPVQLARSSGSFAVNPDRHWVAYSEVDADGATTKLRLATVPAGKVVKTIAAPDPTMIVRGFVGDAVLLSQRAGDAEQARRWNPDANGFTDLGGGFADVVATQAATKLAVLGIADTKCAVVTFIEFGRVFDRGRDCKGGLDGAVFSPDGAQLAAGSPGATQVVVLKTAKGLRHVATIDLGGALQQLTWDGTDALAVITAGSGAGTVQRCVVASGACTTVWQPGTAAVRFVR